MAAPLTITPTEIPDVLLIESRLFSDDRGHFMEAQSQEAWEQQGLNFDFVHDSMSRSRKGVLRGMHYQLNPHAQGKLVRCIRGALFDVAVDIRKGSPTFGRWAGRELREGTGAALWIPPGFAHGLLALEDDTVMYYKCTAGYRPQLERAIAFDDPAVGIDWPIAPSIINDKDRNAPRLADAESNFDYKERRP